MFVRRKGWVTINFTASQRRDTFLTKMYKGRLKLQLSLYCLLVLKQLLLFLVIIHSMCCLVFCFGFGYRANHIVSYDSCNTAEICRCWTNFSWSVKHYPLPPKLSQSERNLYGELFIHFALIIRRKNAMSELHWALPLHSTRFVLLNNIFDNIIIAICDGTSPGKLGRSSLNSAFTHVN